MKKIFYIIFLFLFVYNAKAQTKFFISLESGVSLNKISSIAENGSYIYKANAANAYGALYVTKYFTSKSFLQIGFLPKEHITAIKLKTQSYSRLGISTDVMMFPIKIGYDFLSDKRKWQLNATLGYVPVFEITNADGAGVFSGWQNSLVYPNDYIFKARELNKNFYNLITAGIGLDIRLSKKFLLYATTNYFKGLENMLIGDIYYDVNGVNKYSGVVKDKGSFVNFSLGAKYNLNKKIVTKKFR